MKYVNKYWRQVVPGAARIECIPDLAADITRTLDALKMLKPITRNP